MAALAALLLLLLVSHAQPKVFLRSGRPQEAPCPGVSWPGSWWGSRGSPGRPWGTGSASHRLQGTLANQHTLSYSQWESSYNTSATNDNKGGSRDYGIFQVLVICAVFIYHPDQ